MLPINIRYGKLLIPCLRLNMNTKATNLNTMHVDYQKHNAKELTHIEHNRLFYPIVK